MNVIDKSAEVSRQIADLGVLVVIAGVFLTIVVFGGAYFVSKFFKLQDKHVEMVKEQVIALNNSTNATKENTEIYRGTKEIHDNLNSDMNDVKRDIQIIKKDIEEVKWKYQRNEDDRAEIIKALNDLTEKLDTLLEKAS